MNPRRPLLLTLAQKGFPAADRFVAAFARLGKAVPALQEAGLPVSCRREAMAFLRVNLGLEMANDRGRCGRGEPHPDAPLVAAAWAKVRGAVEAAYAMPSREELAERERVAQRRAYAANPEPKRARSRAYQAERRAASV